MSTTFHTLISMHAIQTRLSKPFALFAIVGKANVLKGIDCPFAPLATWITLQSLPLEFSLSPLLYSLISFKGSYHTPINQPAQMAYYYINKRGISRDLMEDYWNLRCFLRNNFIL